MKPILVIAAMIGFSASAAMADCVMNKNTSASISVDREFKTASITPPTEPAQKPIMILKKTDRLPGNAESVVGSPQSALLRMQ